MFVPAKIKQESVVQTVINSIKDSLLNNTLNPGERLPSVQALATSMDVSVATVREAIKVLEGLGVIESKQGKGTFVCTDLKQDAVDVMTFQLLVLPRTNREIINFRIMYETAFTVMAMENATQEDLDRLEGIVSGLEQRASSSAQGSVQDELDFHSGVLECTHNPYVIRLGYTMLELFMTTIKRPPRPNEKYIVAVDHRRIFEAMKAKDEARLRQELERNFSGWKEKYFNTKEELGSL